MPLRSSDILRLDVSVNGDLISGLMRASIAATNCFSADTYSLTFAVGGEASAGIGFWSSISSALIEVTAVTVSSYGQKYQPLIIGMADTIRVDPVRGTVGVEGRDLSSSMIDSYRQQDFVNQTASEIVATIAQYHGLQAVVAPTSGNIGRYYSDGYTKLSLGQFSRTRSDWDLVVQLARQNDFNVFVQGQLLYFQPSNDSELAPIPISLRDVKTLRVERSLNLLDQSGAKVQSWNSQNMIAYSSDGAGQAPVVGQDVTASNPSFLFSGSNYTSQQVTDSARQYSSELARLTTVLNAEMPWDLTFAPRATCLLLDTGSAFDTTYRIETIERLYCPTAGSKQLLRAAQI